MKHLVALALLFAVTAHAEIELIGDDNVCGEFGRELEIKLGAYRTCKAGSGPAYWAKHLPALNSESEIVVVLGKKDLAQPKVDGSYKRLAQKIAKQTKHCQWVGPAVPQEMKMQKNLDPFYKQLEKQIAPCKLLDSRKVTMHHESQVTWAKDIK